MEDRAEHPMPSTILARTISNRVSVCKTRRVVKDAELSMHRSRRTGRSQTAAMSAFADCNYSMSNAGHSSELNTSDETNVSIGMSTTDTPEGPNNSTLPGNPSTVGLDDEPLDFAASKMLSLDD